MIVLSVRGVNHALREGMRLLKSSGVEQPSRDGPVLTMPVPVTTFYHAPTERVMFDPGRDANPFFHLFESMWMLSGSNDGKWLDNWVGDFSERFGQPDGRIWGAYGHRWREHFEDNWEDESGDTDRLDQIDAAINILSSNPNSRQVVIGMWDPGSDMRAPPDVKDRPCNLSICLRVRERLGDQQLDMTVMCRSNDIVWGAYGANAVHMSILQEYVATALGMRVGYYWQVSNDFHIYTSRATKLLERNWHEPDWTTDHYRSGAVEHRPMFVQDGIPYLRRDLQTWMADPWNRPECSIYNDALFNQLLVPMARALGSHRDRTPDTADMWLSDIIHSDWQLAAREWILRRRK